MIPELISDLIEERISLTQAFTKAKVISTQTNNPAFSSWVNKEINGYDDNDTSLPNYRILDCDTHLIAQSSTGQRIRFPVRLAEPYKSVEEFINFLRVPTSIAAIEYQLKELNDAKSIYKLPTNEVEAVSLLYTKQIESMNGIIIGGEKEIAKIQYQNIIFQTKNRLLDELLALQKEARD